jgi:hypothetical protein
MERRTWIVVLAVLFVLIAAIIMIALWQTDTFNTTTESATKTQIRIDDDKPSEPSASHDKDVNHISKTTVLPVPEAEQIFETTEQQLKQSLDRWLKDVHMVDVRVGGDMPADDEVSREIIVAQNKWSCSRSILQPPGGALKGDFFGYSMDAAGGLVAISAPGVEHKSGAVYVFDQNLQHHQTLKASSRGKRFGISCLLSPDGKVLVVQSDDTVHIFRKADLDFVLEQELALDNYNQVLGAAPCNTIWVSNQTDGLIHVYDFIDGTWQNVCTRSVMGMDMSYEPETKHVWLASSEGLRHWSRDLQGDWTENASWLTDIALTTVDQFEPKSGQHEGINLLVLGQAHTDSMTLVSAMNPHEIIDRIEVPGGHQSHQNVLFADTALWWDTAQSIVVTLPLDYVNGTKHCGAVIIYQLTQDSRLMPVCMLRGDRVDAASQFGSIVKVHQDNALLISASGAGKGRGEVLVFEKTK